MFTAFFIGYILYHLGLLNGWCLGVYITWLVINIFCTGFQVAQKIEEMR